LRSGLESKRFWPVGKNQSWKWPIASWQANRGPGSMGQMMGYKTHIELKIAKDPSFLIPQHGIGQSGGIARE